MDYVLTTFDELVYGQLDSPLANLQKTSEYIQFLENHFPDCSLITIGVFKETNTDLKLIRRKELCCLHPEVERYIESQLQLFDDCHFSEIHPNCFVQLNIDPGNVKRIISRKHRRSVSFSFIEPSRWDRLSENNIRFFYYCAILKQEKERVIQAIKSATHNINSRQELELFIHKNQQSIFSLCLKVLNRLSLEKKYKGCMIRNEYSAHDIFNLVYLYLEKILRFIERNYRPYLGNDLNVPYRSYLLEELGIDEKAKCIQNYLQHSDLEEKLTSIVLSPLKKLSELSPIHRITYDELLYFNRFVNKLNTEFQREENRSEEQLISILIQLNFNSPDLLNYLTNQYKKSIAELSDNPARLHHLYRIQKDINQLQSCKHCALIPSDSDLKTQLSLWLDEEIHFLSFTNRIEQACSFIKSSCPQQLPKKLAMNLSVPEISLLFRILNDGGLLQTENQSELFAFIAEHFQSKKQSSISVNSIRQRYYNPDDYAVKSLIEQLKIILRNLERI